MTQSKATEALPFPEWVNTRYIGLVNGTTPAPNNPFVASLLEEAKTVNAEAILLTQQIQNLEAQLQNTRNAFQQKQGSLGALQRMLYKWDHEPMREAQKAEPAVLPAEAG